MRVALLISAGVAAGLVGIALAQVPEGTDLRRPSMPLYRATSGSGKMLDCVVTGTSVTNLGPQVALVEDFEMQSFRNGDAKQVQIIAQAPQCQVNVATGVLSDAGHIEIFTPTTNLFVEGVGFLFVQSNHFLSISNQVETRVLKALIKSSMFSNSRSNAPSAPGQVVRIFARAGQFNFDSNVVDYAGGVHLIDPQLDMTSDFLTIRFTTNGAVESMLARQNVVLTTTNNGRATGATGFYWVTNGNEMMRLTQDAKWRNGDEQADADEFLYDSTLHLLTGIGRVKARWPNAAPGRANSPPPATATNVFRELYADVASLQFPPTNGPLESMHAHGNVLIVNEADTTSAKADVADYHKTGGRLELTGHPVWWGTNMEVKADVLSADLDDKVYYAHTNAHFKMRTGAGPANQATGAGKHPANEWIFITSDDMKYRTNMAEFYRNVDARMVDSDVTKDTLTCALLTIDLTNNKVENIHARDDVHGESAPDTAGVVKTIDCALLNAHYDLATGRLKTLDAHTNVVIKEKGTAPGAPFNTVSADLVTARFSPFTNELEEATAEANVVFTQRKVGHTIRATSEHALYLAGTNDEVRLTGHPLAYRENYSITNSDYLIWKPKANVFRAAGRYHIVPTKSVAKPDHS